MTQKHKPNVRKEFLNPSSLPNWQHVFSQIVTSDCCGTRTVYVAGQVAVDPQKQLIGLGDLRTQAVQTFANLETALAAAGAKPNDVVKLNIYVVNYKPGHAEIISAALRKTFPHEDLPASTWLGVASLAEEGFLIEVDAIAVVDGDNDHEGAGE